MASERTPEGEFTLSRRKAVLPPSTDQHAVWLLVQDFVKNSSTSPGRVLDLLSDMRSAACGPGGGMQVAFSLTDPFTITSGIWDAIQLWEWMFGDDDCLNPDQETQCTEKNVEGEETTITFKCECGTPICNPVNMWVEIPVTVIDSNTGEQHTETHYADVVMCACYCLQMSPGGPG